MAPGDGDSVIGKLCPDLAPGWVWLVGAGPGDPASLTLGGYHALQQAEIVLHDALVGPGILGLIPENTPREPVGKRAGQPSPVQAEIGQRLVTHAAAGRRVVRLKGGDPFMFGRGAEEALDLVRAGVPFRVVPGVPAGVGGLAHAGIPATARDTNDAVTFLTGHALSDNAKTSDRLNWEAIAQGSPAIVVYMGMRYLDTLAQRLLDGGRSAREPVAVVYKATLPEQAVLETTLAQLAEDAAAAKMTAPALVVIGEIARLRAGLDWVGALSGRVLTPDPLG
jgi:uroporphyrin-III C-methyltransferase